MATSPSAMASAVEVAIKIIRGAVAVPKGPQRDMLERQLTDTATAMRAIDRDNAAYRALAIELNERRSQQ